MVASSTKAEVVFPPETEPGPIAHQKVSPSKDYAILMKEVTATTGKTYFAQVKDMVRLATGQGSLSPMEYFLYALFDDAVPEAKKAAFVGHKLRARIVGGHFDPEIFEVGLDKLAFYERALELGLQTPRVVAVAHPERSFSDAESLRGKDDLLAFLRRARYPLFGKPNKLSASVGTASLTRYHRDDDELEMGDGRRFPAERIAQELERYIAGGYLFQDRLDPHPEIRAVAGPILSTIRMMVLDLGDGPFVLRASWRVPVAGQVADTAWRGNIMAAIDPRRGVCERAGQGRGLERRALDHHPDSGRPIVGKALPDWEAACALALRAAAGFPELPLTGWDMALTDNGPVIVELEPDGGDPSVTQLASGVGLLEGPYATFVEKVLAAGRFKPSRRKRPA